MLYGRKIWSSEDLAELKRLEQCVQDAKDQLRDWTHAKVLEYSPLKVGDDIYDIKKRYYLGIVSQVSSYDGGNVHYRYVDPDQPNSHHNAEGSDFCRSFGSFEALKDSIRKELTETLVSVGATSDNIEKVVDQKAKRPKRIWSMCRRRAA